MFAALVIERARLTWSDFWQWPLVSAQMGFVEYWVQWVGGFAAVGLVLWLLAGGYRRSDTPRENVGLSVASTLLVLVLVLGTFGLFLLVLLARGWQPSRATLTVRGAGWKSPLLRDLFWAAVVFSACAYFPYVAVVFFKWLLWLFGAVGYAFRVLLLGDRDAVAPIQPVIESRPLVLFGRVVAPDWHRFCFTLGGLGALVAVLLPFLAHLTELSWRRIWALARLTVKEVVRRRVFWVFGALAIVFLFAAWFIDTKPEHQVHSYVGVVYLAMATLLWFTGSLLASFSLPTDIRQQTIHTILTKPVQRLEVVVGRFLGFMLVMTVALAGMSALSLVYVLRGVDLEAAKESLKARVPLTGELVYEGADDPRKGTNVGEEWDYRGYISGKMPGKAVQYAIWSLHDLPADLGSRETVPCEFTFNIYRTTKASPAEEGKGVFCTFLLTTAFCPLTRSDPEQPWVPVRLAEIEAERQRLRKESLTEAQINDKIAEQFGVYEVKATPVFNFHTQGFTVPGGLFRNQSLGQQELQKRLRELQEKGRLSQADAEEARSMEAALRGARGPLQVRARCDSRTQFLGMAEHDLYLLAAEQPFALNFFKGAVGLWFGVCLLVGVAVACSTYLSGVITWLCAGFLFLMGTFREYAQAVAEGHNEGGGPMESMIRLFTRSVPAAPLDESAMKSMASFSDQIFRWFMKLFMAVFPDVQRYDFSGLVASGFNVPVLELALTALYLAGYLLPWLVLAYYLVRSREVATW
jgi:hypothetical protein